jgi:hypothetical protein
MRARVRTKVKFKARARHLIQIRYIFASIKVSLSK